MQLNNRLLMNHADSDDEETADMAVIVAALR